MIYAILLFGLDIVVGYTGQVSLGHAGLFGIGAYSAGVLVTKLATPLLVTLIGAIGITSVFGAVLALPALRVTGPVPGDGDAGLRHDHPDPHQRDDLPHRGPARHQAHQARCCSACSSTSAASSGSSRRCSCSRSSSSTTSCARISAVHSKRLRGSPVASDCMGVSVYRYKVYAFVISAGLRGARGCAVLVLRAVHLAQHLQLRADRAVPARCHHGRPQDPHRRDPRRDNHCRSCPSCSTISSSSATSRWCSAIVVAIVGRDRGPARQAHSAADGDSGRRQHRPGRRSRSCCKA